MRTLTLLTFIVGALSAQAQFEIDSFVYDSEYDDSKFPIIRSSENPQAAELINIVLHHYALEKVYEEEDENRFENVFPPEGEFHGADDFSYNITANNDRYFSVSITCAYTGAYTEYHTQYFNFDAKTGQPIQLSDMFGLSAMYDLADWVSSSIHEQIVSYMNNIDLEDPEGYGQEQYELYAECAEWYVEPQSLSEEYYFLTDSSITFVKGRCSNHMMAALDELWEFYEEYSLVELQSMMSDDGIALMFREQLNYNHVTVPVGKVLKGKIAGKYPITMIVKHSYGDSYYGVYWYDKVKQPIKLSGELDDAAYVHFTEEVNDKTTGKFDLQVMQGGTLDGEWKNMDGTKTFDITLMIAK